MIRILIAEDNLASQKALLEKLSVFEDILVKKVVSNGREVFEYITKNRSVDLIMMDIEMPEMNGIQATQMIKSAYPQVKIVMITIHDDDDNIFQAIRAGADSYLLKETKADKIYETIKEALAGGAVMSPSIALRTLKMLRNPIENSTTSNPEVELSLREIEVLEQLCKGLKNKKIAENLFISPFTVKGHVQNIYKKLQAHNRVDLINKAQQNRLI